MIFIALGTQSNDFSRCLKSFEEVIRMFKIEEKVIAQVGNTMYRSLLMESLEFVSEKEFQRCIEEASVIVTHAGSGALFSAIKKGKRTIAVARLSKYGEMIDDHQTELCRKLSEEGYLIDGTYDMIEAWRKVQDFVPRRNDFICTLPQQLTKQIDMILKN